MSAAVAASGLFADVLVLNVIATTMLARSDFETPRQKLLQLAFVWVVPCVGSIVVIAVLRGAAADPAPYVAGDSSVNVWLAGSAPVAEAFGSPHAGHGESACDAGHVGDGGGGH